MEISLRTNNNIFPVNSNFPFFTQSKPYMTTIQELKTFFQQCKEKTIDCENVIIFFEKLFTKFSKYSNTKTLISSYQTFLGDNQKSNYSTIRKKIKNKINKYLENKEYFNIHDLLSIIISNLIDQNIIQTKFKEKKSCKTNSLQENQIYFLKDLPNNGDFNSSIKFCVDNKCHFYYQKTYSNFEGEHLTKEIDIFHTDFTNEYPSFIVHSDNELERNKIIFPYFPFQTLKIFLDLVQNDQSDITFTTVDKFVIIKEICIGLQQLHEHSIYHQNLNSSYIVINNNKDSYISNFAFDLKLEQHQSKPVPSFYYRHPDLIKCPNYLSMNDYLDSTEQMKCIIYDIYSFGILMYEIITTISPNNLFDNISRQERINILSNNYKEFLFSKYDKEKVDFDSKYGIEGIRKIIEKCIDIKNTYSSMKEILIDLDKLPIYQTKENKDEIDYRITHVTNINEYKCTLSDLVNNYYLGNHISERLIQLFLKQMNSNYQTKIKNDKDIISNILEIFEVKNENTKYEEETLVYEDIIKSIIQQELNQPIEQNYSNFTSNQTKLMSLSIKINEDPKQYLTNETNLITNQILTTMKCYTNLIPITSFDKFINKFKRTEMIPIYLYFIAKEISIIHSYGLYHGEISPKSIGIYYNTKTETFLPSIIPFYFFFKNTQNKPTNNEQFLYEDRITFQRKDVKQFLKIIKRVDETELIPDDIYENETINSIIIQLYNLNISNENQNIQSIFIQNYENYQYSTFEFTFQKIHEIFTCYDKTNSTYEIIKYFLITNKDESYINLKDVINEIYEFICIKQSNEPNSTENSLKETEIEEIELKLKKIKETNDNFITEYYEEQEIYNDIESIELSITPETISITKLPKTHVKNKKGIKGVIHNKILIEESFYRFKINEFKPKRKNLDKKQVFRCIDLYVDLQYKSFEFLFRRYIRCLHPKINYKVSVRFVQSENKNITLNDVINIGNRFGHRGTNINGNIVFEIKR